MYLLYAHLVSPIVEPTQLTAQEPPYNSQIDPEESRPGDQDSVAAEFLPDQDWAKDAANQFRIGDMFLYANTVEQEPANGHDAAKNVDQQGGNAQVRFRPFALVWKNPKGKSGEPPLRITAEAAVIQFESAFDLTNPKPGRAVFGSLEGEVRIEGPNGLKIVGRGFTFSEQALRLWSDSDIQFHYGPHHGTGHGLQVDFLPGDEQLIARDQPRLGGLRSVSLLRQVVLNLVGEAAGPTGKRQSPLKAGDQIRVDSDGRMQYDVEANLITFDHRVRVRHPLPSGQEEGLNCDLLSLVLSKPKPSIPPAQNPSATTDAIELASNETEADQGMSGWLPDKLNLDKMLADGSGKRRVEIFSQPRDLHCNTAQVEYDLVKRILTLRDPATVDVLQGTQELHAPEISLTLHENNRDIRQAIARGIGNASSRLKDGRTVTAKWQRQLVKSTHPQTGVDIIELQGAASIALDLMYELSGDALHVETTPLAMSVDPADANRQPSPKNAPPQVQRVAGLGQVVLKSPQATSHTNHLDVRFQTVALPPEVRGQKDSLFGLQPADERPPVQRGRRGVTRQEAPTIPFDVAAETVRALISRDQIDGNRLVLANLWADDAVTVTQPMKPGEPPVQMLGDHLHVENILPNQQLAKLTGAPAQIRSGTSRLEGSDIRLDRQANTLNVVGAGVLQYPVNVALDGQPLDRPQVLQVKWAEKLVFDGQTADFYEKVEASMRQTVMRCNAMHVRLVQPLRFDDPELRSLARSRLQLEKISCENKVELESAEYQGNIIISRSFGRLGQFVIDNVTGKTEALGPGYFMEWRRGQRADDTRLTVNKVAKPIAPQGKAQPWTYSRIDFQGLMKGNVHERFTTFEDHVEIVYGPVEHATDRIEPDALPDGAASITCDALKVEQYAETPTAAAFVKLSAEGNTKLELEWDGQPLYAQADEVKFDESKDYYLLRSIGNQKVIINREPTTDDPRGRIVCSRVDIIFNQLKGQRKFTVHNATEFNGLQQ